MHPQQAPSQGNMPLPAFKSTTSHAHDKKERFWSEDDAMARGCAPDAAAVPLPTSLRRATPAPKLAEPMTPVRSTCVPPTTPAGKAVASPAPGRRSSGAEVLAEISRILAVPGGAGASAGGWRWAQQVLRLEGREVGAASKAFRRIAREIHPDGRLPLSEEDEIRCHEALAQLQRARRRLCGGAAVAQRPPKRPERLRCEVRNAAWYITWQRRDDACGVLRYELRVQDGSFLVTVAELDAATDVSKTGFELRKGQLSQRLLQLLQANGWLGIRVAALGAGGCSLSDEATLWLRELTEAGSKFNLSSF